MPCIDLSPERFKPKLRIAFGGVIVDVTPANSRGNESISIMCLQIRDVINSERTSA